jgi:DNA-binding CsgD family transcriptional regulator
MGFVPGVQPFVSWQVARKAVDAIRAIRYDDDGRVPGVVQIQGVVVKKVDRVQVVSNDLHSDTSCQVQFTGVLHIDQVALCRESTTWPDQLIGVAREEEVLKLMAEGLRNKEIAARLNITERTATFHVGNVLSKLGADGRVEAIHFARLRGLI